VKMIIAFVVVLAGAFSVAAEEVPLEQHFREYIGNWKPDADIDAVVAEYWGATATMYPPGESAVQLSNPGEIAAALKAAMRPVIDAGWQGSALVAFSSCRLRKDLALVGIDFQRRYPEGRTTNDSAAYIVVLKGNAWKIQAVMASQTHSVGC